MKPILEGDRGPAVEDVQRRLALLGFDIGPTGIDGVFHGATLAAVRAFQTQHEVAEDGCVGPETWSALVDATFSLGDRLLYLRFPYLHGADVRALQGALNALGFAAGDIDGIFGSYAERAVREFQRNTGLPVDGIAGPETIRVLSNLRHVWGDRATDAPVRSRREPARDGASLKGVVVTIAPLDPAGEVVARRLENLARASVPAARVRLGGEPAAGGLLVCIGRQVSEEMEGLPLVSAGEGGDALAARFEAAIRSASEPAKSIEVALPEQIEDELTQQRIAVGLLDGLCLALAPADRSVLP